MLLSLFYSQQGSSPASELVLLGCFDAVTHSAGAVISIPVFLLAMLAARGLPALAYGRTVGPARVVAAGLLQATSLPLIVVAAQIGVENNTITPAVQAALVAAGLLSVIIFPAVAQTLIRSSRIAFPEA